MDQELHELNLNGKEYTTREVLIDEIWPVEMLPSPTSLCLPHFRPINLRDEVLKKGIWLYTEPS